MALSHRVLFYWCCGKHFVHSHWSMAWSETNKASKEGKKNCRIVIYILNHLKKIKHWIYNGSELFLLSDVINTIPKRINFFFIQRKVNLKKMTMHGPLRNFGNGNGKK